MHLAVFGSASVGSDDPVFDEAVALGRAIAEAGWPVATGGYGGLMEAVSKGAAAAGGQVVGVTAPELFPDRAGPNPWVSEESPAASLTDRIGRLIDDAGAVIALPGAVGTGAELLVAWHDAQIRRSAGRGARPILAVGAGWAGLVRTFESLSPAGTGLVSTAPSVTEAIPWVVRLDPLPEVRA